ncbi:hypothetical protein CYLTODRAFT_444198 [Cylindrobasidium torrendii FP15055 ss-10]|uniref:WW domain-containing protein n=1 Tax=Cylindrobasidium torrendii FP15055 ss-10 TaxID=1314674 RepID=A0A0D7BCA2_9AGAR|nr:hypothetical protein CYLTODRAFT_444198 [Cylindrobasidium torrendii FP15055 ss-10]
MSQPPPPNNPDVRPLPQGWVTQYDFNYRTWFFVNTAVNPPQVQWVHPYGPPNYGPPAGSPPPQGYGGYQQPGYGSPPPQVPYGGYDNRGFDSPGGSYQGGYGQQPVQQQPQPVYAAEQPKEKKGLSTGAVVGIGAAGLVGGALIANALDDDGEDAYKAGFEDGAEAAEEDNDSD